MDIEKHSRARQVELGRSLFGRRKIYLDACFWIMLRDVELGSKADSAEHELLHFLRLGVSTGKLICPISSSMFFELMKQPFGPNRRQATAQLIDELSLGVTAINSKQLLGTEIYRFFLSKCRGGNATHAMQELLWTKVAYVLGDHYLVIPGLSAEEQLPIQRYIYDYLWECPLTEIVEMIGETGMQGDEYRKLSEETNAQNLLHRHELKSFERAYDIELRGAIELAGEIGADIVAELASKDAGQALSFTQKDRSRIVNACCNILYESMKIAEHRDALRTLHIGTSLHASMRWDKERKFKPNDYYDLEHATIALAYCDAFLTERPLHVLVTRPQVDLEQVNGCRVISDVGIATVLVRKLLEQDYV